MEDKEFSLIQEISLRPHQTQRQLSSEVGLSLGMTNILLMRLVRKGYVKIRQLDWKRTEYLLTLAGAMEKARKTYAYTLHTIRLYRSVMENVQKVIKEEYDRGTRRAIIVAWPETVAAISGALKELALDDLEVEFVDNFKTLGGRPGMVLVATEEPAPKPGPGQHFVPLLNGGALKFSFPDVP